jgi:hypothetical protein
MAVQQTAAHRIHSQAAIALALLSAWENRPRENGGAPKLEDICQLLVTLLDNGIEVEDLGLRSVPGGVYSEDVESFVGHLLAEGLATHRSPLQLAVRGENLLRAIVRFEYKGHESAVKRAADLLKLDTSDLLAGLA